MRLSVGGATPRGQLLRGINWLHLEPFPREARRSATIRYRACATPAQPNGCSLGVSLH